MTAPAPLKHFSHSDVEEVITWPLVIDAVEEALKAVVRSRKDETNTNASYAQQPARSFTTVEDQPPGFLLTMPGFVGNYSLNGQTTPQSTLACKLVTSFEKNPYREMPMPVIVANILLFDNQTGRLQCVMDATEITAKRTAAASIIATKYLYFKGDIDKPIVLAVLGLGVQGRIHAIAFCTLFNVTEIHLYNRTYTKTDNLAIELEGMKESFRYKNLKVFNHRDRVGECALNADVVITATITPLPLLNLKDIKSKVHINAIGAGAIHHTELGQDIYDTAEVYIDHWENAKTELKDLKANIVCELGEMIIEGKQPKGPITIFQSLGMAAEDACVAQAIFNAKK